MALEPEPPDSPAQPWPDSQGDSPEPPNRVEDSQPEQTIIPESTLAALRTLGENPISSPEILSHSTDRRTEQRAAVSALDVLLLVVMSLVFTFIATAFAGAAVRITHFESLQQMATDARILIPVQLVVYAATFLLMIGLVRRNHQQRFWRGVRWIWPSRFIVAVGFLLLGAPLAFGINYLETVLPMPTEVPFEKFLNNAAAVWMMGALAVFAAPFMEELFFRGFLYPVLRRWGALLSVTLTALAFATVHGAQYGWGWAVGLMFIVGLALTLARAWTGSVAPGFLIHSGYNLTLFVSLYLTTDHFRHLERLAQ